MSDSIRHTFLRRQWRSLRRLLGYERAIRHRPTGSLKVLLLGGFGYGNTGDEAQLGANLQRWRKVRPDADLTVLSPNPIYTRRQHAVASEYASRVLFFKADLDLHFKHSDAVFKWRFWRLYPRMLINVHLMRAGFAPAFASAEEAALLLQLHAADIVHISGGGFLTGMTRSRLWDTCLVMILCQGLGTPYFLTGQSIGIFQTRADRWLAKKALSAALSISLRDGAHSMDDLLRLGVAETSLHGDVDDAFFCEKSADEEIRALLIQNGIAPDQPYVCVNFHFREMSESTRLACTERLAELLDRLVVTVGTQILFVPMHAVDAPAEQAVIDTMQQKAHLLRYPYDYRMARAAIAGAECLISFKHHPLIFALAEGVPCLSISLDEYYRRKNHGAMQHLEQQHYCVHGEAFFQATTDTLVQTLFAERAETRTALSSAMHRLRDAHESYMQSLFSGIGKTN